MPTNLSDCRCHGADPACSRQPAFDPAFGLVHDMCAERCALCLAVLRVKVLEAFAAAAELAA